MKKTELLKIVAEKTKVKVHVVDQVSKVLVKTIVESVQKGEKVTISGLGTFRLKNRKAKPARNLQTGETLHLPEGKRFLSSPRSLLRKNAPKPKTASLLHSPLKKKGWMQIPRHSFGMPPL